MSKQRAVLKILLGLGLILLGIGMTFAGDDGGGYSNGNFSAWAKNLVNVIGEVESFIQIVATLAGMWFVFSGLNLFRKHHTSQGAQVEHVKNGIAHMMIGVFLMCLVPAIQMIQSTIMSGAGESKAQKVFEVKSDNFQ